MSYETTKTPTLETPAPAPSVAAKQDATTAHFTHQHARSRAEAGPEPTKDEDLPTLSRRDIKKAIDAFIKLAPAQQSRAWRELGPERRLASARALRYRMTNEPAIQAALKIAAWETPDAEAEVVELLFEARFHVDVGQVKSKQYTGLDWTPRGLRRAWVTLETLPPAHVEKNFLLKNVDRFDAGSAFYNILRREVTMSYSDRTIGDVRTFAGDPGIDWQLDWFDDALRHEIGHAVEWTVMAMPRLMMTRLGGDWKTHFSKDNVVEKMVAASNGAIAALPRAQRKAVEEVLEAAIRKDAKSVGDGLTALPFWSELEPPTQQAILADPAVSTVKYNREAFSPWYSPSNVCGTRHFVESYAGLWTSYDIAARSRAVSNYAFRSPAEWFAEAYAEYYKPTASGEVGEHLAKKDPGVKAWFDQHVHKPRAKDGKKGTAKSTAGGKGHG